MPSPALKEKDIGAKIIMKEKTAKEIVLKPIGYIKSDHKCFENIAKQSVLAEKERAKIIVEKEFMSGLLGLEDLSHIVVLFYFDRSSGYSLRLEPKHRDKVTGVFATRSPNRPNGIGLSIVKLIEVKENVIEFEGVDMVDGTPVLDIKPYNQKLNP